MFIGFNRFGELLERLSEKSAIARDPQCGIGEGEFTRCDIERVREFAGFDQRRDQIAGDRRIAGPAAMRVPEMADRTSGIAGSRPHHAEKGIEGDHIAALQKRAFGQLACTPPVAGLGGAHCLPEDIGGPWIEHRCGSHVRSLSCSAVPMQSYYSRHRAEQAKRRGGWSEGPAAPRSKR